MVSEHEEEPMNEANRSTGFSIKSASFDHLPPFVLRSRAKRERMMEWRNKWAGAWTSGKMSASSPTLHIYIGTQDDDQREDRNRSRPGQIQVKEVPLVRPMVVAANLCCISSFLGQTNPLGSCFDVSVSACVCVYVCVLTLCKQTNWSFFIVLYFLWANIDYL